MSNDNEGMDVYNDYKEQSRGRSRSRHDDSPFNPRKNSPRPQSFGPGASYPYDGCFALFENHYLLITNNLDETTALIVPTCYQWGFCRHGDTEWYMGTCAERLVKTCVAYEHIGEPHPRLVRYIGRDPWVDMPILEKPTGPSLYDFLRKHHERIFNYEGDGSIRHPYPKYLPLIYQWTLQALSAILFSHKHGVLVGSFDTELFTVCLPDLSISLIGFISAAFKDRHSETEYESDIMGFTSPDPFEELSDGEPIVTISTDLFFFGTLVHSFMKDGTPRIGVGSSETPPKDEWACLDRKHLGEIMTKCWKYEYQNAQEVKDDILKVLNEQGWEVEGEDTLKGFDATKLFEGHLGETGDSV